VVIVTVFGAGRGGGNGAGFHSGSGEVLAVAVRFEGGGREVFIGGKPSMRSPDARIKRRGSLH
jgi:hypothetical protein